VSPYVRTVKTASNARAMQIVHSSRRGSRDIKHIGSAHDDDELEVLKAVARQRLAPVRASWTWVWSRLSLPEAAAVRCRSSTPTTA
jgi:hypothetical protein